MPKPRPTVGPVSQRETNLFPGAMFKFSGGAEIGRDFYCHQCLVKVTWGESRQDPTIPSHANEGMKRL